MEVVYTAPLHERLNRPQHSVHGRIVEVRWSGMGDWPDFIMETTEGLRGEWERKGSVRRYVEGLAISIALWGTATSVIRRLRDPALTSPAPFSIAIEQSDRRSSGVMIGPGGSAWRDAGGPGTRIHYVVCSDQAVRARLMGLLGDRTSLTGHWVDAGDGVVAVTGGTAQDIDAVARDVGGRYDGYEELRVAGGPLCLGPLAALAKA
jgi:hypothetical protein